MSLAMVVQLATAVAFLIILAGGRPKREGGWKILSGLLGGVAAIQFCALSIVVSSLSHPFSPPASADARAPVAGLPPR